MPHTEILLDWLAGLEHYDAVWGHYLFPGGFLASWFGQTRGGNPAAPDLTARPHLAGLEDLRGPP